MISSKIAVFEATIAENNQHSDNNQSNSYITNIAKKKSRKSVRFNRGGLNSGSNHSSNANSAIVEEDATIGEDQSIPEWIKQENSKAKDHDNLSFFDSSIQGDSISLIDNNFNESMSSFSEMSSFYPPSYQDSFTTTILEDSCDMSLSLPKTSSCNNRMRQRRHILTCSALESSRKSNLLSAEYKNKIKASGSSSLNDSGATCSLTLDASYVS